MVGLAASVRRNTGVHAGHPPQRPTRMPTLGASELQSQFLPRGQALPHCEYQRDCRKQRCGAQHSRPARPHWPNSGTQEAVLVATARAWAPRFMDGLVQQQRQVRDGAWRALRLTWRSVVCRGAPSWRDFCRFESPSAHLPTSRPFSFTAKLSSKVNLDDGLHPLSMLYIDPACTSHQPL